MMNIINRRHRNVQLGKAVSFSRRVFDDLDTGMNISRRFQIDLALNFKF